MTESSKVEASLALTKAQQQVRDEFAKIPDSEEMTIKVCEKLQHTYDNPPIVDFEFLLNKPFSADEVRVSLFQPRSEQVSHLVQGLRVGVSMPKGHNLRKLASLLLTLIYLVHRKEWTFIEEFILADGLEAIVVLLQDANYYERSQAMEILMTVTDCDTFDWFLPPPQHTTRSSFVVQQLHMKLLGLSRNPEFLNNLVKNRHDSYPGGSFRALQQLAFWLSWVRALYTVDHRLALSENLLNEIKIWSTPNEDDSEEMGEERKLAATLYEDFGKLQAASVGGEEKYSLDGVTFPTTDNTANIATSIASSAMAVSQESANSTTEIVDVVLPAVSIESVSKLKDDGNEHYKKAHYHEAKATYIQSLQLFEQLKSNEENTGLEVSLRSNLANTLWKLFAEEGDAVEKESCLSACAEQCLKVLDKEPLHSKAAYRLISVYIEQHKLQEAYDYCELFVGKLRSGESSGENVDMFTRLQKRVVANKLISGDDFDPKAWGLDAYKLRIVQNLLKRNQLQDQVNVDRFLLAVEEVEENKSKVVTSQPEENLSAILSNIKLEDIDNEAHARKVIEANKKSMKVRKEDKVVKEVVEVKLKKLTTEDKKLVQDLKSKAKSLAAIKSRSKLEGNESLASESQAILVAALETVNKLWQKKFTIRDMFPLPMEEPDVLLFLTLIASHSNAESGLDVSEAIKFTEQLAEYDRIQSLLFLAKLEYPVIKEAVDSTLAKLKEVPDISKRAVKAIGIIVKALA